jgi:GT2 family glycosyltransferase
MDVSIIIVNYNTKDLLLNCIQSVIEKTHDIQYEIIVVDNASGDGSVEMVRNTFPKIKLIDEKKNWGFGRANNLAVHVAKGRYLFLLNSDTLLRNNAIKILADFLDQNNDAAICGGQLFNQNFSPATSFQQLPTLIAEWKVCFAPFLLRKGQPGFSNPTKVGFISGADLMIRKTVFDKLNGFDPHFFLYFEETELTYRTKRLNYTVWFVPDAQIIHLGEQSGEPDAQKINKWTFAETWYSRFLYAYKTAGLSNTRWVYNIHRTKGILAQSLFRLLGDTTKSIYWTKKNDIIRTQYRRFLEWKETFS